MKQRTETHFNRKAIDFRTSKIDQVLPDYFKEDYPNLIKFLEYYYDFMDSDGTHSFNSDIRELMIAKDIESTSLDLLDNIFKEVGLGTSQDFFTNPRQEAALFAKFFRVKGSLYSSEGFFRSFFDEQPTISYPKEDIFRVGESNIGPESIKFLTDNKLYQLFSVLIKVSQPVSKWGELYKQFAHPAGWYFEGQVQIEGIGDLLESDGMPLPGLVENVRTMVSSASMSPTAFTSMSGIYDDAGDSDSIPERIDLNAIIDLYDSATVAELDTIYSDIEDVIDLQSPTMDEDSGGETLIEMSNTLDKMDKDNYDI